MNIDNKYLYLPEKFWKKHDICEFLTSQLEEFITDSTYKDLKFKKIDLKHENEYQEGEHPLDFLLRTNRKEIHDEMLTNQIVHALLIDICYFLQEALSCSKKRRLVVTFSLLRKPFVYDLMVLLRLVFEDDFLEKFNSKEVFDTTGLTKEDKILLLNKSADYLISKSITGNKLFELIFDSENTDSIFNLSNRALHPSTTRNINNLTGKQNLNFVFSNPEDILNQWQYIYSALPILLLYYVEIIEIFIFASLNLKTEILTSRYKVRAECKYRTN